MKSWCYVMDADGRSVAVPLREAECHPPVAPFTWIHLDGRDEANLVWLRERSNIPRHAVSALTAVETRPPGKKHLVRKNQRCDCRQLQHKIFGKIQAHPITRIKVGIRHFPYHTIRMATSDMPKTVPKPGTGLKTAFLIPCCRLPITAWRSALRRQRPAPRH